MNFGIVELGAIGAVAALLVLLSLLRKQEPVVRCPDCHTDDPGVAVIGLVSVVIRKRWWLFGDKRAASLRSGERVACQRCPCVYSVGPNGVFRQHPHSAPLMGQPAATVHPRPTREELLEQEPPVLVPRERPRV